MEEKQQFIRFREYGIVQCQQQHNEPRGTERWPLRVSCPESNFDIHRNSFEARTTKKSDRTCKNERGVAWLIVVDNGTGHPGIRHPQAQVQILLILWSQPQNWCGQNQHDLRASKMAITRWRDWVHGGRDAHVRCSSGVYSLPYPIFHKWGILIDKIDTKRMS